MNSRLRLALSHALVAAVLFDGAGALAGAADNSTVSFYSDPSGRMVARGSLTPTRNSSNEVEQIGCDISSGRLYCMAQRASDGAIRSCITDQRNFIEVARMLKPTAWLKFVVGADRSSCYQVEIAIDSSTL